MPESLVLRISVEFLYIVLRLEEEEGESRNKRSKKQIISFKLIQINNNLIPERQNIEISFIMS